MIVAEDVPIDDLRPHPRNYQSHPPDQLDEIGHSIRQHGYFRNVVAARDLTILAGHGVVEAARRLGHETVPVKVLDCDPDSIEARQVMIADNEISRLAEVDDRALTEMLKEILDEAETALAGTGFNAEQLAALAYVSRTAAELADFDAAAEWVGLPGFEAVDPPVSLHVIFDDEQARDDFVDEYGFQIRKRIGRRWTMVYPPRPLDDLASVRWE